MLKVNINKANLKRDKKNAFTLAEVLVTLGVIGVLATVTIPSLVVGQQKKTYETAIHKAHTELSQAVQNYITEKNAISVNESGLLRSQGNIDNFIKEHFKILKDCGTSSGCFAPSYKALKSGTTLPMNNTGNSLGNDTFSHFYLTANGLAITFNTYGNVYLDTNGPKGPNIAGRDFYFLKIHDDGVIDDLNVDKKCRNGILTGGLLCGFTNKNATEYREYLYTTYCAKTTAQTKMYEMTEGCLGHLINNNWVMDY